MAERWDNYVEYGLADIERKLASLGHVCRTPNESYLLDNDRHNPKCWSMRPSEFHNFMRSFPDSTLPLMDVGLWYYIDNNNYGCIEENTKQGDIANINKLASNPFNIVMGLPTRYSNYLKHMREKYRFILRRGIMNDPLPEDEYVG